jgi:hypothetical protein
MGVNQMRKLCLVLICVCVALLLADSAAARDRVARGLRPEQPWTAEASERIDPGLRGLYDEAAVDTYCIVWYDFESLNWQAWSRLDLTAQRDTFFRVDDFAGLGGGDFGRLHPLEGARSMWCGSRQNPADPYLCSWMKAPGYGNRWDQSLTTESLSLVGSVTISYKIRWDCEQDYDFVKVEYDAGGGDWRSLASHTGHGYSVASEVLYLTQPATKLRFHFASDDAYSDEDGLLNTDGACIVDSVRVSDLGGFSNYENFEGAAAGDRSAGIWHGKAGTAFGMYSGLKAGMSIGDRDPCNMNFSTQIVFFIGSPHPSTSYPGLYDTPFCTGYGGHAAPCQNELVYSPIIDLTKYSTAHNGVQDASIPPGDLPLLGGCQLRYTEYDDNPLGNLVLSQWKIRNIGETGCPGQWVDFNFIYWYGSPGYNFFSENIGSLITESEIQVAVGLFDMCDVWYLVNGDCAKHTPAPWFDNVRLYRWKADGPQWSYRELDLFQDNFPENEFYLESYVRADAANDVNTNDNPVIRPGDSIVVDCSSTLGGGIAADPAGGPAVYVHVKCAYIGPAPTKSNLHGASLQGTYGRYKSDNGVWTIIQGDTARAAGHVTANKYMFDLNDSLFTRGYEIDYYFTALSNIGAESALPRWARSYGPYFEFTCLPTENSHVLFVDDFSGRGSFVGTTENYWIPTFWAALSAPDNHVDKYDVNGPTSGVSNGPGSRAKNRQLTDQYYAIVWDSGDLSSITISDGTTGSDKSNDCQMLIDWMDLSEHYCGLWVCGDGIASDLATDASTSAMTLMSTKCGVTLVNNSYFELTGGRTGGGVINPLIEGDSDANIFVHGTAPPVPDKFYAFGGCPLINLFDVLGKTASGKWALDYPAFGGSNYYAGIATSWENSAGYSVRTMWFGFSFQFIRDDRVITPIDRFEIAADVFSWMQFYHNPCCCCTGTEAPSAYRLAQNFPNPFNPSTTIRYDMKEKGLVRIKIYNVAGELVRTLVDEMKNAGAYSIAWDGRNNAGSGVASGIYFYKMETRAFSQTKKMVVLR